MRESAAGERVAGCELCEADGGVILFRGGGTGDGGEKWRVVRVAGAEGHAFTGYCRVIWNAHIKELTDLSASDRQLFMEVVFQVETALRASLSPHKMNIASLGNLTPHLHWHVIPRFVEDPAFPKPIWAITLPSEAGLATLEGIQRPRSADCQNGGWEEVVRRALEMIGAK